MPALDICGIDERFKTVNRPNCVALKFDRMVVQLMVS